MSELTMWGTSMRRYVILHHVTPSRETRATHWDFMLECEGVLRTWALPQPPRAGQSMIGQALADHRIEYLTYEGPVSRDRGHVTQWDRGQYTILNDQGDCLAIQLVGDRLRCEVTITRDRGDSTRWHFVVGQ